MGKTAMGMGKGVFYLSIANIAFVISSYAIQIGMGRYLGPAEFGIFGVIISLMTIINTFFSTGFPQGASKYIAADDMNLAAIIKDSNKITLVFCILVFASYMALAGVISNLFNDPHLAFYIRISAFSIPVYAFGSMYRSGYLNGQRQFGKQSITLFGSSVTKVAVVFALVLLGFGVTGAILGYIAAALVGFFLAWKFTGRVKKPDTYFETRKLVEFGIPATVFAVAFLLLMSIDLFMVKAIGGGQLDVGYYNAASTISRVPYFLLTGLALVLLPSISRSTSINDKNLTRKYILQSMRYMLMLLIPGTLLISTTSTSLLTLIYSQVYVPAAPSLSILIFGLALLSVFFVLSSIIMGAGKPTVIISMAVPLIGVDIFLNIVLIPPYGLVGSAWATTITGFIGTCSAVIYVIWKFRALVGLKSFARICLSSVVIYILASKLSLRPVFLPAVYICLFALYFGILWLLKEFNDEDLATIKKILPPLKPLRFRNQPVSLTRQERIEGDRRNE